MTVAERAHYIAAVVHAIHGKTPEAARISSADFDIVAKWMDRDIPLRVVLQGIEDMDKPASIRHARPAIEQEIERWHRAVPR